VSRCLCRTDFFNQFLVRASRHASLVFSSLVFPSVCVTPGVLGRHLCLSVRGRRSRGWFLDSSVPLGFLFSHRTEGSAARRFYFLAVHHHRAGSVRVRPCCTYLAPGSFCSMRIPVLLEPVPLVLCSRLVLLLPVRSCVLNVYGLLQKEVGIALESPDQKT
jgi:hypothetical protein